MKKLIAAPLLLCIAVFFVSCSAVKKQVSETISESVSVDKPTISLPTGGLSLSDMFEGDEYLVADRDTSKWLSCGKMLTPPSESTHEAEFLTYNNSQKAWKRYFVQIAPAKNFNVGDELIYFTGNAKEGVYHPPADRSSAREKNWYKALVTDTSLVKSRGVVYIGGKRVDVSAAFVPVTAAN